MFPALRHGEGRVVAALTTEVRRGAAPAWRPCAHTMCPRVTLCPVTGRCSALRVRVRCQDVFDEEAPL